MVSDPRPIADGFIGRHARIDWLDTEFAAVAAGSLRVVLLVGEAGVGKTRLASEFVSRHQAAVVALSARAYPLGATASLGLWVEALERRPAGVYPRRGGRSVRRPRRGPGRRFFLPCGGLIPLGAASAAVANPPRIRVLGGARATCSTAWRIDVPSS